MYEVSLSPRAQKALRNLSSINRKRVANSIDNLAENPFPEGKKVKKLSAVPNGWRLRVGEIRILYTIEEKSIKIYKIKQRGDAY